MTQFAVRRTPKPDDRILTNATHPFDPKATHGVRTSGRSKWFAYRLDTQPCCNSGYAVATHSFSIIKAPPVMSPLGSHQAHRLEIVVPKKMGYLRLRIT